jgi:ABC-2 type transport system permease protein
LFNLIRSELKKITKKKVIYIMFFVTLAFMILINIVGKKFQSTSYVIYDDESMNYYKEQLTPELEESDPDYYADCKSMYDSYELAKKYDEDSWQRQVISQRIQPLLKIMYLEKSGETYNNARTKYDKDVEALEKNDWKYFVYQDLDETNLQILMIDESTSNQLESLKDTKQALEWRLEKNISYDNSDLNSYLQCWLNARVSIRQYKDNKNPSQTEKVYHQQDVATEAIARYAIENGIDGTISNQGNSNLKYGLAYSAKSELFDAFSGYSLFIIILIIIVAGTIVSEEFNKGTIKLLLVRPYSRVKILLSKYITCLIVLICSIIFVALMQTVVGGIVYGFDSYKNPTVLYNYATNSLNVVSMTGTLAIMAVAILPKLILLMTLAFTLSTVITNTPVAIAIPLLGSMVESIINQLAIMYEKANFLKYFVTPNWDFSQYLYGALPQMKGITLGFSVCICLAYFIVMMALSIWNFKKKNIKNI